MPQHLGQKIRINSDDYALRKRTSTEIDGLWAYLVVVREFLHNSTLTSYDNVIAGIHYNVRIGKYWKSKMNKMHEFSFLLIRDSE